MNKPLHLTLKPAAAPSAAQYEIHVVFSTDCKPFQDWQSLVVFQGAVNVGQQGPVTRIASGCDADKQAALTELYKKLYPQYSAHFTPDFKRDEKTKARCKLNINALNSATSMHACCLQTTSTTSRAG
jgi:hypothetical protein